MVSGMVRTAPAAPRSFPLSAAPPAAAPECELLRILAPEAAGRLPALAAWSSLESADLEFRFGITHEDAERLGAALELGRRAVIASQVLPEPLRGGAEVFALLHPRLAALPTETFHALYVDAKGRLVHERPVSIGTLTSALVHPREVFAPAVALRAAAVIVAHNHPSGDPEPSAEDRATTRRLQRAGRLIGIELLDHVVIARAGYVSFLERGWLTGQ